MFEDAVGLLLGSLLAELFGRDPGPVGRMIKAYRASFEEAGSTGSWDDEVLMSHLRRLTVPGAYSSHADPLTQKALEAWAQRLEPPLVKRLSRRWRDGVP